MPFLIRILLMAILFAGFSAVYVYADEADQRRGGRIHAVDLIGAWVDAGAPEKEPFRFKGLDGKTYEATFEEDIRPLFTQPNVWGPGIPACTKCHFAISKDSAHEMDLSNYKGIMTGGDSVSKPDKPAKLFTPGDWKNSMLRKRLRNNRMPPGMPFDITEANRDGPVVTTSSGGKLEAVKLIGAWVDAGAPEKEPFEFTGIDGKTYSGTFEADILPLFTKPDVWAPRTEACSECHHSVSKNSAHEMDLSSYKGILLGADSVSNPQNPAKIIIPGDWNNSVLRERLRNNRMPVGMLFDITEANRDGPVLVAGNLVEAKAAPAVQVTPTPSAMPQWFIPVTILVVIAVLAAVFPVRKGPPLS